MKTFKIDVSSVDGLGRTGETFTYNGRMTVEPEKDLEGYENSDVNLSLADARKLHGYLAQALQSLDKQQGEK